MTTKLKIIIGFVIMIVLMGTLACLGYLGLQTSSDGFNEYRRLSGFNVAGSESVAKINDIMSDIHAYEAFDEQKYVDSALKKIDELAALLKSAEQFLEKGSSNRELSSIIADTEKLKGTIAVIQNNIAGVKKQYNESLQPAMRNMADKLTQLGERARGVDNIEAVLGVARTLEEVASARSSLGRLSESRSLEDCKSSLENLGGVGDALDKLGTLLFNSQVRAIYAELQKAYTVVQKALDDTIARCNALDASIKQMDALNAAMTGQLNALNNDANNSMLEQGSKTLAANTAAQTTMLIMSAVGMLIGIALAIFIIFGIVRVLNELARFAGAIAEGRFDYQVKTHEKGEIGRMVDAMHEIPEALNQVLNEYKILEQHIESGRLGAQGDPAKFHGDFATLIRGTNAILSRFLMVLENIPSPVVILDKDLKASYLNIVAREVAGSDFQGKTCLQLFGRDDFGSNTDALKVAVDTRHKASAETRAHPQGKHMDISYTAIPMLDAQGRIASVMQLITDLTAIKSTQRTIMDVAAQAQDISSRVAAASEQLSAQVEQVSRGAEMQRSRVESTASAMTEMNSTVLEVARSAGQASEQSELTRRKANDGAGLVNKVVQSINLVNTVATTLQTNMQELGKQAESVGGVMNVISDIADQTNLLALNAAIEAARAGEAGRGFAVVADEVRKLAEKTMSATHEVGSNINAIQNSTRTNIEEVGQAAKAVGDATNLANSSGAALKEIVELASANSSVVASIATAAEEQSATSEEINRAIEEINQIVGDTTDGMVQASSAVSELSQMAQQLRRVMDGLK